MLPVLLVGAADASGGGCRTGGHRDAQKRWSRRCCIATLKEPGTRLGWPADLDDVSHSIRVM